MHKEKIKTQLIIISAVHYPQLKAFADLDIGRFE